ncbi:Outer membrane lipoprotein omp16 precursor [Enhygromyxa salina]|uniref:Outer membrane lipoprotein omp16 n=1 Tax=Enhygromyxa salina TaxID=215803 RepID=A0A0C1ZWF7_9BACT|nr:Outer membrane lipoprotein omp16 precursor [Enhygromyxa salina]
MAAALGLGLLATGCGPIAFNDTVNYKLAAPEPEPEPEPPAARAQLSGDHIVIDGMIQFEYDSAEIKSVSNELLDAVVKVMQDNPGIEQLDVIGHTSSEGSKKHNDKLSTDRAASVMAYLKSHGIDGKRLVSHGKGPSEPVADNDTEEGRIANRRVEFKVTKMAAGAPEAGAADSKGGARGKPGAGH